jgi:IS30 family transposase
MKKQLSEDERIEIRRLLKDWKKHDEIGFSLCRSQSTISREIKDNSINGDYHPLRAEKLSRQRRIDANVANSKLLRNKNLREKIIGKLCSEDEDWSPDTIVWRLKKEKQEYVCTGTIYKYIYKHEPWLRKFLRYKKWYKKRWTKQLKLLWQNKKHIGERDPIIEKRTRIWDIEVDTVVSKWRTCRLFTAFDRKSRLCWIRKLRTGKAEEVCEVMIATFKWEKILSITPDNGTEFADRELTELYLQTPIYFATPYHSRERGTNENGNRCVRKYVPKKFDFSNVSDETFEKIEKKLNNKPRKILNYRTPFEVHYRKKTRLLF